MRNLSAATRLLLALLALAWLAGCAARPRMAAEYDADATGEVPKHIKKQEQYTIITQSESTVAYNRGALHGMGGNVATHSAVPDDDGLEIDDRLPSSSGRGQDPYESPLKEEEGMPDATITQEEGRGMPDGRQGQEPYVANNEGEMLRPGQSASGSLQDSFNLDDLAHSEIKPEMKADTKPAAGSGKVTEMSATEALKSGQNDADVNQAIEQMEQAASQKEEITGGGESLAETVQKEATEANAPTAIQGLPVVTSRTKTDTYVDQVTKDTMDDGTVETTREITPHETETSTAGAPEPVEVTTPEVEVGAEPPNVPESADAKLADEMNNMAGEKGDIPPPEAPVDTPVAQKGAHAGEQVKPDDPVQEKQEAEKVAKEPPPEPAETLAGSVQEVMPEETGSFSQDGATKPEDMRVETQPFSETYVRNDENQGDPLAPGRKPEPVSAPEETGAAPEPATAPPVDEIATSEGAPMDSVSEINVDESRSLKVPEMNVAGAANADPMSPADSVVEVKEEATAKVEKTADATVTEASETVTVKSAEVKEAAEEKVAEAGDAATEKVTEVAAGSGEAITQSSAVVSETTESAVEAVSEKAPSASDGPEVEAAVGEESSVEEVAATTPPADDTSATESVTETAASESMAVVEETPGEAEEEATASVSESASEETGETATTEPAGEMPAEVEEDAGEVQLAMRDETQLPGSLTETVEETATAEVKEEAPAGDPTKSLQGVPLKDINTPATVPDDIAVISTRLGDIVIELDGKAAPQTVTNFKRLADEKFYDRTTFHRVIPGFIVQGGDPNSKEGDRATHGEGGPGYVIKPEISLKHKRGSLAAARLPDDVNPLRYSNGSQFYICVVDAPSLDGENTVFGQVIKGMEVIDKIAVLPRDDDANPLRPLYMQVEVMSREEYDGN